MYQRVQNYSVIIDTSFTLYPLSERRSNTYHVAGRASVFTRQAQAACFLVATMSHCYDEDGNEDTSKFFDRSGPDAPDGTLFLRWACTNPFGSEPWNPSQIQQLQKTTYSPVFAVQHVFPPRGFADPRHGSWADQFVWVATDETQTRDLLSFINIVKVHYLVVHQ